MAPVSQDTPVTQTGQDEFQTLIQAQRRQAVRLALMAILEEETALIGAHPYERTPNRRDQRKGSYTRDLETSVGHLDDLQVPRTRNGHRTQVFERHQRRRPEVDQTIQDIFVRGVSTQGVGAILEQLNGTQPSSSTASLVFHTSEAEYDTWKKRALADHYVYAFADGTYFSIIYAHEGNQTPILAVIGVRPDGQREVLSVSPNR